MTTTTTPAPIMPQDTIPMIFSRLEERSATWKTCSGAVFDSSSKTIVELAGAEEGALALEAAELGELELAGLEEGALDAETVELGAPETSEPDDAELEDGEEEGIVVGLVSISANAWGESPAISRSRKVSPVKKQNGAINFLRAIMGSFFCSFLRILRKILHWFPCRIGLFSSVTN